MIDSGTTDEPAGEASDEEASDEGTPEEVVDSRDAAALDAHPHVHRACPSTGKASRPDRVVSLVPSLTESLAVLGMRDRLVGVTEYCVHPAEALVGIQRVGGTKDVDVEAIVRLRPDLVIANQEENTLRTVRHLAEQGIDVWVTYPRTVAEGAALLAEMAGLGATPDRVAAHVTPVLDAVRGAQAARAGSEAGARPGPGVFCPIWRDPWMAVAADTYIHDMIELCGGRNLFAEFTSRGASDRRYPIVDLADVVEAQPEVILLPDEPYAFAEVDAAELTGLDLPAARSGRVHLIDGTLVSWYGPRIDEAIRVLAAIFANR